MFDSSQDLNALARNAAILNSIDDLIADYVEEAVELYDHDADGSGDEITCNVGFSETTDTAISEPFSWGGSRGVSTEKTRRMVWAQIGRIKFDRSQMISLIGQAAIERCERGAI